MIKTRHIILSAVAFLFVSASLHAQSGCGDSPEAPTVVLMVIGSVGMFFGSFALRNKKQVPPFADLDTASDVAVKHLVEAVRYRTLDHNYWD